MDKKLVYNGGSMTTYQARDFQLKMNDIIEEAGLSVYTPSLNSEINDKEAVGNKDIAKMIVAKDSEAIINSDIRMFNNSGTVGTSIEIGQVLGMNDFANIIKKTIEQEEKREPEHELSEEDRLQGIIDHVWLLCNSELNKDFILFDVDVRSHDKPEAGYKRSKGYHQYERGVGMRLMHNEEGYLRLEEQVIPKLKELGKSETEQAIKVNVKFDNNDELQLGGNLNV
ncbi:TIR domain-containing protein [Mammaliicoccus sciuri]|uniref:hypothetical protein n=1 Tax=Mammaliicoccus sciuri TaxID=1296 RepID=UPI0021D07545|nr:hypothetical protein [Mammaliicoccus sciuri]UXU70231.1 hypothetical protein MUA36_05980 [Mammaliicoccus sciuri]